MKKTMAILAIMFVSAMGVQAIDVHACLSYLYQAAPAGSWELSDMGKGVYVSKWNLPTPQPTKQQIIDAWPQAEIWWINKQKTDESDIEKMPEQMKAVIKALVKVVNLRLPADKKITQAEMVAAIKDEL